MTGAVTCFEHVINEVPFTVRRRVKWSECDPAGVVYTATFSEYVLSAAELFYSSLLGGPPQSMKSAMDCGTPTRALAFDFQRSLKPDDEFDMTVTVIDVRTRTFVLEIDARTREGDVVFQATLTPICIGRAERRGVAVPEVLRTKLEQYRADHAAARQPH